MAETPASERKGFVFNPGCVSGNRLLSNAAGRVILDIGAKARIVTNA